MADVVDTLDAFEAKWKREPKVIFNVVDCARGSARRSASWSPTRWCTDCSSTVTRGKCPKSAGRDRQGAFADERDVVQVRSRASRVAAYREHSLSHMAQDLLYGFISGGSARRMIFRKHGTADPLRCFEACLLLCYRPGNSGRGDPND